MPLLRRRSVLDLLNANSASRQDEDEDTLRPPNGALSAPLPSSPHRLVPDHGYPPSRLSHEVSADEIVDDTRSTASRKRFSMLKMRNFSESHLAAKAKEEAARSRLREQVTRPPLPESTHAGQPRPEMVGPPTIIRTAPTVESGDDEHGEHAEQQPDRKVRPSLFKRSMSKGREGPSHPRKSLETKREKPKSSLRWRKLQGRSTGLEDLARLSSIHAEQAQRSAPPSYGDESQSALALPVPDPRYSESRDSDGSSGDVYGQTTITTHTVSTHTTFFKLRRRNDNSRNANRNSLFPLPIKLPASDQQLPKASEPATPRASISGCSTRSLQTPSSDSRTPSQATYFQRRHTETSPIKQGSAHDHPPLPPNSSVHAALARTSLAFTEPGFARAASPLGRNGSQRSRNSSTSSPLQPPMRLGMRGRASTASSLGQASGDVEMPPGFGGAGNGRSSSSTTGRSSLGGFLTLSRFRNGSQGDTPRYGSPGTRSKSNSFALSREALVIPEREEGDTPGKYLERLEAAVSRSMIAGILSKSADPFAQAVLRSYTRRFPFFGEPIDMSLRKFLLEADLPKETQQVDRVIQAFADRYHECNPGIFVSPDQAYVIAFSLMMLHTDAFNKNNKRKMQKHDYLKNTSGQQVADEVLACFYDNIVYTPFVHYEEEVDINGERVMPWKPVPKKPGGIVGGSKLKGAIIGENGVTLGKGPVDPYNLLVDQKLDVLRPNIKDSIAFDDPYNYRAPNQPDWDPRYLQRAFTHTGILQIISARSRPTAYEGRLVNNTAPSGTTAPGLSTETQAGIIDLKITKVGTLWRKAPKKKKARSPWQEWGAILTGSQLYLFQNAHWAKNLVHQFTSAQKPGQPRNPVIFKPPLQDFKPDALLKTDQAVALVDQGYTRHKHAFVFWRKGGVAGGLQEEVLLAENETELGEWLALINYAAAFRAAGVRIRGMVGGHEEDLRRREVERLNSTHSVKSLQSARGDQVTVRNGGLSPQLQRQVMVARRQIMVQKIAETEKEVAETNAKLEGLLRDARHLVILAPILQRTREDILHAAAKADANIKWSRRDVWRLKCCRDVLAMDVRLDGVTAQELEKLTISTTEEGRQRASSLARNLSKTVSSASPHDAVPARSPPLSPTSATGRSDRRPSTKRSSIETLMGGDVFQTPPESAEEDETGIPATEGYRVPPLQLNRSSSPQSQKQPGLHRASVTSILLPSAPSSSQLGRGSLSHASSTSSVRPVSSTADDRRTSETPSGRADAVTPTRSYEDSEIEKLARASDSMLNLDSAVSRPPTTPDSKSRSVRRSLQKTLREAGSHHVSSVHRHRRGKESDGTVRSGGETEDPNATETPGLQREKGRFILHGKQASVVQFGGSEWPNERMRARREKWRQGNGDDVKDRLTSPLTTDTMHDLVTNVTETEVSDGFSSPFSVDGGFARDAAAADAFANGRGRNASTVSSDGLGSFVGDFDLGQSGFETGSRRTALRPGEPQNEQSIAADHEDGDRGQGTAESDIEDFPLSARDQRKTVIGPSGNGNANKALSSSSDTGIPGKASVALEAQDRFHQSGNTEALAGAEEEDGEGDEDVDDSMISQPIGDAELRRISRQAQAVAG